MKNKKQWGEVIKKISKINSKTLPEKLHKGLKLKKNLLLLKILPEIR